MADLQKSSHVSANVEYDIPGKQKSSHVSANVEYDIPGKQKSSHISANVEYTDPDQVKIAGVMGLVEYEPPPYVYVNGVLAQIEYENLPLGHSRFTSEPRFLARWKIDYGNALADSIGSNTLTQIGTISSAAMAIGSGKRKPFLLTNGYVAFERADADLPAGFPLKSGDTAKRGTFCGFFRLQCSGGFFPTAYYDIISKHDYNEANSSFAIYLYDSKLYFQFMYAYNQWETKLIKSGMVHAQDYHFGIAFDAVAKSYTFRLRNLSTGEVETIAWSATEEMLASNEAFRIGCQGAFAGYTNYFEGIIDDVLVCNEVLTADEIDLIAQGRYAVGNDFSEDATCAAHWQFEKADLTADSIGTNTLTAVGYPMNSAYGAQGTGSAKLNRLYSQYFEIADASLSAGFPLKSGDSAKKATYCFWYNPSSATGDKIVLSKWATNKKTFLLNHADAELELSWGYNSGASQEDWTSIATLTETQWYHVGLVIDGAAKTAKIRLWDETAGSATNYETTFTNALSISDAKFCIGGQDSGANPGNGYFDEGVAFSRCLDDSEIDDVREMIYAEAEAPGGAVPGLFFLNG